MQIQLNQTYCVSPQNKKSIILNVEFNKGIEKAAYYEVFRYGEIIVTPTTNEEVVKLQKMVNGDSEGFSEMDFSDTSLNFTNDGDCMEFEVNSYILNHYHRLSEEYGELMDTLMEDDGWSSDYYYTIEGPIEVTV